MLISVSVPDKDTSKVRKTIVEQTKMCIEVFVNNRRVIFIFSVFEGLNSSLLIADY